MHLHTVPCSIVITGALLTAASVCAQSALDFHILSAGSPSGFHGQSDFSDVARRSAEFEFTSSWNANPRAGGDAGCANSMGNNVAIQTNGSGNVVYVLNNQASAGDVRAQCTMQRR